jgi:hypothetical protein
MKIALSRGQGKYIGDLAPFKSFAVSINATGPTPMTICFGKTSCSFLIKDSVQVDIDFDSQVDCLSVKTDKLIKEVTIDFFDDKEGNEASI